MQAANDDGEWWYLSVISEKVERWQFIYIACHCNLIAYPQEGSAYDFVQQKKKSEKVLFKKIYKYDHSYIKGIIIYKYLNIIYVQICTNCISSCTVIL